MGLTWEEAEFLIQVARDASLGDCFSSRFEAISQNLLVLVPGVALTAVVVGGDLKSPESNSYFHSQDPQDMLRYLNHYKDLDPMGPTIGTATGLPVLLSDCLEERNFGADAFTGEFLPRQDIRHILGLALKLRGGSRLALALHRSRVHGDFTLKERKIVELITPDLGRAASGALLLQQVNELKKSAGGAGSQGAPQAGTMIFDHRFQVVLADPGARGILDRFQDELSVEDLARHARRASRNLQESEAAERVLSLAGGGALRLTATLTKTQSRSAEVLVLIELLRTPQKGSDFEDLARQIGLTPRECEVARLAVAGDGNKGIAYKLGIKPVTVSVHLTKVYRKAGVGGRVELARLLARS